jgi:hypothetical protein
MSNADACQYSKKTIKSLILFNFIDLAQTLHSNTHTPRWRGMRRVGLIKPGGGTSYE